MASEGVHIYAQRIGHLRKRHRTKRTRPQFTQPERIGDVGVFVQPLVIGHADNDRYHGAAIGDDGLFAGCSNLPHQRLYR